MGNYIQYFIVDEKNLDSNLNEITNIEASGLFTGICGCTFSQTKWPIPNYNEDSDIFNRFNKMKHLGELIYSQIVNNADEDRWVYEEDFNEIPPEFREAIVYFFCTKLDVVDVFGSIPEQIINDFITINRNKNQSDFVFEKSKFHLLKL